MTSADERPAVPAAAQRHNFPFAGELTVKQLEPPVLPEPPRNGDPGGQPCSRCPQPDSAYLWTDDHWRLTAPRRSALPFIGMLETRQHLDLGELPADLAAELGQLTVRIDRAVCQLEGVARVHVNRWGDGLAHLHFWFYARPAGMMQLYGHFLPVWNELLPQLPEERWYANLRQVADALAAHGGGVQL